MKKWKLGLSAALASMLTLAACGNNNDNTSEPQQSDNNGNATQTYTIGLTQFVEHPSLDEATKGFKQAIADAGLQVEYDEKNAQNDQNNTIS